MSDSLSQPSLISNLSKQEESLSLRPALQCTRAEDQPISPHTNYPQKLSKVNGRGKTKRNGALISSLSSQAKPLVASPSAKQIKKLKRDGLLALNAAMQSGDLEELRKKENMARPGLSRLRRREGSRASDSNIMIPMSVLDMFKISHNINSLPTVDSSEIIHSGDQYICPVPACGLSFARKETAFAHLQTHEHKKQLSTPAPLIDAHMRHFWPAGATWREGAQFVASEPEPLEKEVPCPIEGCGKVLLTGRLEAHMRIFHPKVRDYKLLGELYSVPPMEPVTGLPLKWCTKHVLSSARCPVCLEIERDHGSPKPPYTFYNTLEIDFSAKKRLGGRRLGTNKEEVVSFNTENDYGALYERSQGRELLQGEVVAIFKDRKNMGWIAVQTFSDVDISAPSSSSVLTYVPSLLSSKIPMNESNHEFIHMLKIQAIKGYFQMTEKPILFKKLL